MPSGARSPSGPGDLDRLVDAARVHKQLSLNYDGPQFCPLPLKRFTEGVRMWSSPGLPPISMTVQRDP